jgi:hypothetical protein
LGVIRELLRLPVHPTTHIGIALPFRIAVYLFGERLEMQSVVQMKEAFHQQPTHDHFGKEAHGLIRGRNCHLSSFLAYGII